MLHTAANDSRAQAGEDPQDSTAALAALCKASGDPLRLMILRALRQDSFGVGELCSLFDMRQPALSHHLKVLANAGLVASRREGNSIFYRRNTVATAPALEDLQRELLASADALPLPTELAQRLADLQRQREDNSRDFFRKSAHKFREQQELIAAFDHYAEAVAQLIDQAPLPGRDLVLEVGPGDGAFLAELAPRFKRVVALDNAEEMLQRARERGAELQLENVEYLHGDTRSPALNALRADCVVINMVLHHTPAPGDILQDIANHLAPAGVVVISELCRHDQGWARENCGDLWLGFEPEELTQWASAAGLQECASAYLAQRNGFQLQVRAFRATDQQGTSA